MVIIIILYLTSRGTHTGHGRTGQARRDGVCQLWSSKPCVGQEFGQNSASCRISQSFTAQGLLMSVQQSLSSSSSLTKDDEPAGWQVRTRNGLLKCHFCVRMCTREDKSCMSTTTHRDDDYDCGFFAPSPIIINCVFIVGHQHPVAPLPTTVDTPGHGTGQGEHLMRQWPVLERGWMELFLFHLKRDRILFSGYLLLVG